MNELIVWPAAGRYILAVSGGADSMVLLGLLAAAAPQRGYELVVAHFDHGIRTGSHQDREFVGRAAAARGLPFEHQEGRLGPAASEATARAARYTWLESVRAAHDAAAIITAHHQDDLLETSLLNLARGTGRRGLAPMQSGPVLRPLLAVTRQRLRTYATDRQIAWREDPTNADLANPRNFLRHQLLPSAPPAWRARYLELLTQLAKLNKKVDQSISTILTAARDDTTGDPVYSFSHSAIRNFSPAELEEVLLAAALRLRPDTQFNRRIIQEAALFARTAGPGKRRQLARNLEVVVQNHRVKLYCTGISVVKVGK